MHQTEITNEFTILLQTNSVLVFTLHLFISKILHN